MGCVRPSRERDPDGSHPLPSKKRSRFRFKHKASKSRRAEAEKPEEERGRAHGPEDEDQNTAALESSRRLAPDTIVTYPHSNTLSPGSVSAILQRTPNPSPAWRGVFCLPGEEDAVSAIVDVSSIPSQTTTTLVNTPGGGRVCRVREKAQGVLEKPWILRQKEKDESRADKDGPSQDVDDPSERERRGVIHIREVGGKLCVVRTVYPTDCGSPVWSGDGVSGMEVHKDRPASSPIVEGILKAQLLEDRRTSPQLQVEDPTTGKRSLLESGYSSDLPLTSPETAGTTPSQTDWGGLTSSSSEKLDSMMESPLLPRQQLAIKHLPQVCEFNQEPGQVLESTTCPC